MEALAMEKGTPGKTTEGDQLTVTCSPVGTWPSMEMVPTDSVVHQTYLASWAKDFNGVTLGKTWDMISTEVCAAPQQHHVPAVSARTCVLGRDFGNPGL
ncbi:hypothetical protein WISP_129390 [Willisornis vidua]|uniref:Ig-like domain-containing protein n=1 Tax=Willisornis vidua TaxID=1566151 RepID=A0ABQ9CV33_9PASS|nr:hypothetical protein WISP_129390 [Willisornis vidua]